MPPKSSEFDQEMARLEAEIKRLEAEYNMFFAGRLPRLPWDTRKRVDELIKRYDRMTISNTAARFRFATLQSRYAAFCDLWERTLRAREEGRPQGGRRPASAAPPPAPPPRAEAPASPVVVAATSLRDPAREAERMQELYERLSAARAEAGEPPVAFDRFQAVVQAQVNKLGAGAHDVTFRVAVHGGKVVLTAKADK